MKDDEIVEHVLSELLSDFDALKSAADAAEVGSTKKLATLANARNRVGKTILVFVHAKHDPKYLKLVEGRDDFALLIKNIRQQEGVKQQLMTYKSFDKGLSKKRLSKG